MTRIVPIAAALLTVSLCAGCGEGAGGDGVGGVSASEAQALNDAAAMLDKRPASPAASEPAATQVSDPAAKDGK